jgi:hypothetical protein
VIDQKCMMYFAHRYNYKICYYNSTFRFFCVGAGSKDQDINDSSAYIWTIPRLHSIKDPARAITESIKKCIPNVEDLYAVATGTCLRVGATNEIIHHPRGGLEPAIFMSGHSFSGTCRVFEYALQCNLSFIKVCSPN